MSARAPLIAGALVITLLGAGCSGGDQQPTLTLETSNGYTYVRAHGPSNNDNALYQGVLTAGDDKCLYLKIDQFPAHRYLVVLGQESYFVAGTINTRSSGNVQFSTPEQFGRDSEPAWDTFAPDLLRSCPQADELWGIG